jgi:hypothetical protein
MPLLAAVLASGQTPTIKGHAIGESVSSFFHASRALEMAVDSCANPSAYRNSKYKADEETCEQIASAMAGKRSRISNDIAHELMVSESILPFVGYVEFSAGKLSMMEVNLYGDDWNTVYPDLLKRFGKPTKVDTLELQNGYGARYSLPTVSWVRPGYVVDASENMTILSAHFITIEMATSDRMKELQKEEQLQGSPLD